MSRKMLIDAAHSEEIRVVVCENGKIEEFDYQNTVTKSTKGNVYLAKVTRIEPSLQAAFVDYGGNRHGFLPFSEVHPDYYQIPVSDKEKLLEEIRKSSQESQSDEGEKSRKAKDEDEGEQSELLDDMQDDAYEEDQVDEKKHFHRRYKIQEVLKKDQVLLVQVEKEERGGKGASLTSYITLAGRYCVLMPNATKGGGVSRKIDDYEDRDRLKKIAAELSDQLEGNGAMIVRTAGAYKTKTEIKKDFSYLSKLWNNIREHTLASSAPAFIHEEGNVTKKAIRDLYDADIEEVLVAGKEVYKEAHEFMKLILPRHAVKVKEYKGKTPLFVKHMVEDQLASLHGHQAPLKSGGYLVINHTEALVSIDVNSGKATKERNIEATALKTNLEAAAEVARQMKLRDLSGLIVIDFIDMEQLKNKKAVERVLKDSISNDRARIQMSRISMFGLLEMSRQRLRQSFFESNTNTCTHCNGRGRIRPVESTAIVILRAIESEVVDGKCGEVQISGSAELMFHMLNNKRDEIAALEKAFGVKIIFYTDETAGGDGFFVERKKVKASKKTDVKALSQIDIAPDSLIDEVEEEEEEIIVKKPRGKKSWKKNDKSESKGSAEDRALDSKDETKSDAKGDKPSSGRRRFDKSKGSDDRGKGRKERGAQGSKNQNPKKIPQISEKEELAEAKDYDAKMADRRKDNESLLKEIWKKIVD